MAYLFLWLLPGLAASAALSAFVEVRYPGANSSWIFGALFCAFALVAWVQTSAYRKFSPRQQKLLVEKMEEAKFGIVVLSRGWVIWKVVPGEFHLMVSGLKSMKVIFIGLHIDLEVDPSEFCDFMGRILRGGGAVECSIKPGMWEIQLIESDARWVLRQELKSITQDVDHKKAGREGYCVLFPGSRARNSE